MVRNCFDLNRALWLEALTDQACVIVSIDWMTPVTILLVLQANEWVVSLSNRRKEYQRSKARAKASHNNVLVEGNIDNLFRYLSNHLFCFGCLAVVIHMDKYKWININIYIYIYIYICKSSIIALPCAIRKIKHSALGLDVNIALGFASCYINHLGLVPRDLFSV